MTGTEITRRPAPRSAALAGGIGAVATVAAVTGGPVPALGATAGVTAVVIGTVTGRRGVVDGGALVAFLGVVFAGANDAPAAPVLLGTIATVVAWDVGTNAASLAGQLGRRADTVRVELLHATASIAVGVAAAIAGYVLFRLGPSGQPITTLFVLLVAGTLLTLALNR